MRPLIKCAQGDLCESVERPFDVGIIIRTCKPQEVRVTGNKILEELLVAGLAGSRYRSCDLKVSYVGSSPGAEFACDASEVDDFFH